jgi:hypothetical protein
VAKVTAEIVIWWSCPSCRMGHYYASTTLRKGKKVKCGGCERRHVITKVVRMKEDNPKSIPSPEA